MVINSVFLILIINLKLINFNITAVMAFIMRNHFQTAHVYMLFTYDRCQIVILIIAKPINDCQRV